MTFRGQEQMEQRLEPNVPAPQETLADLGIAYWKLDAEPLIIQ